MLWLSVAVLFAALTTGARLPQIPFASGGGSGAMADGRAFGAGDVVGLERTGAVAVSPDGTLGVLSRWTYDAVNNKAARSLWLLRLDTSVNYDMNNIDINDNINDVNNGLVRLTPETPGTADDSPLFVDRRTVVFLRTSPSAPAPQLMSLPLPTGNNWNTSVTTAAQPVLDRVVGVAIGNMQRVRPGLLSFTADVYADETLEQTERRDERKSAAHSSAVAFDHLYVRHWDTFDSGKNSHVFLLSLALDQHGYARALWHNARDLMFGLRNLSTPVPPFGDVHHYAFSPANNNNNDGHSLTLLFASMNHFDASPQAWATTTHIYSIDVPDTLIQEHADVVRRNATPTCISCRRPQDAVGAKTWPSYSPDGRTIAWLEMETPQYEADRNRIVLLDVVSGALSFPTDNWDRSVSSYIWSNDGAKMYLTAEEYGRTKIFVLDLATRSVTPLVEQHSNANLALVGKDGRRLLFSQSSMTSPNEFFVVDLRTNAARQLTAIHQPKLKQIAMSTPEEFWFTGAMNEKVMGWFLKPVDFDPAKRYPLAFLIHGGPQSAWLDSFSTRWNPQVFAGAGFAVVAINFHGSTGYGQKFVDSITGNWGTHPYEDLMLGLDHVLKHYPFIDGKRVAGLGASYGGYMINWLNGHTDRFACFVNHDGLFDVKSMYYTTEELYFPEHDFGGTPFDRPQLYDLYNPSEFVKNWKTPTLVIHGGKDFRVPDGQGLSTFTALQRQGIPSRLVYFPDENHWVLKPANSLRWHTEVLGWIRRWTA